jgi:hypothetical protein
LVECSFHFPLLFAFQNEFLSLIPCSG